MEQEQYQKTFLRRFWWLFLIIILMAGISFAWITGHKKSGFSNKTGGKVINVSLDSSLEVCPTDTSTLFTKAFMDGDKPDYIIPLGSSYDSGHVVPVDHVYPQNKTYAPDVPIYAPGDMILIWIENKQLYNTNTNEKVAADYQLNFAPCRGINLAFIHLTKLSEKLAAAITEPVDSNCDTSQKIDFGTRNGQPIYYETCHPDFEKVILKAGELIGYFGFSDTKKPQSGFDIGLYDFNKPAVGFINPDRYYEETNHTACFADYYIPELRTKYLAKMGSYDNNKNDNGTFVQPKVNVCGKVMWDVAGTAAGDWFKNNVRAGITDNDALVLIHDNILNDQARLSMAGVTSFIFTPTHTGTTNREFSEIKADGKVYCYQDTEGYKGSSVDKKDNPITIVLPKYLIQLIDDTHLKAEAQSGVCGESEILNNPTTYER